MQTPKQGRRRVLLGATAALVVLMLTSTASARVTLYRADFNGDHDCNDGGKDVGTEETGTIAHVGGESTYVNADLPREPREPPCAVF